jgi:hypothetical protein
MKNELIKFIEENRDGQDFIKCDFEFYNKNRDIVLKGIDRKLFIPCNFNNPLEFNLVFTRWVNKFEE